MAALRSLLEIYGALDDAIIRTQNPAVAATVDAFLPRASANTGWYSEIETFFFGANARSTPDLQRALTEIVQLRLDGNPLTAAQRSRLLFAVSAITRVRQVGGPSTFPSLLPEAAPQQSSQFEARAESAPPGAGVEQSDDSGTRADSARRAEDAFNNWVSYALAAIGPDNVPDDEHRSHRVSFQDQVSFRLPNRQSFYEFRAYAVQQNWITPDTLAVPLCETSVVTIDGIDAVVVDTETSSDDVSLTQLKAVVNPYNWHLNYPDFFCAMSSCSGADRSDGWRRVLEQVGFCQYGGENLRTILKYIGTEVTSDDARLDYDLNDPRGPEGDGQVTVDRGFINMWSTVKNANLPGVRVRTRKVVHINGLLPYAQARLVCLTGYATASNEFLFGAASNPAKGCKEFRYYNIAATEGNAPATGAGGGQPTADHVGTTAVKLWSNTIRDLTNDYFTLAGKWIAGSVQPTDVAEYGKQVTSRLVKAPMEFVDAVSKPRYPGGSAQGGSYPDDPSGTLQRQEDTARALLNELNVIADEAAAEDKAGKWGLDGWIRTIHNLIDLQVRAYAAILQASLAGSWWQRLSLGEPRPSEPITLAPKPFARTLTADTFTRLRQPTRTIPPALIGFRPVYLPAGATQFQIYLKDYRYVGSNYTGKVVLSNKDAPSKYTEEISVTVGL